MSRSRDDSGTIGNLEMTGAGFNKAAIARLFAPLGRYAAADVRPAVGIVQVGDQDGGTALAVSPGIDIDTAAVFNIGTCRKPQFAAIVGDAIGLNGTAV